MSQRVPSHVWFVLAAASFQLLLGLALVPLGGRALQFNIAGFVFLCGMAVGMVVQGRRR